MMTERKKETQREEDKCMHGENGEMERNLKKRIQRDRRARGSERKGMRGQQYWHKKTERNPRKMERHVPARRSV